jgi:hypothetical protein
MVDKEGKEVVPCEYDSLSLSMVDGRISVMVATK